MLGEPAEEPEEVLAAVADAAARLPEVKRVYRAQMYIDRPGELPQLALGAVVDGPGADAVKDELASAATRAGADAIVVVLVDPEQPGDPIADWMLGNIGPFYERDPSNSS